MTENCFPCEKYDYILFLFGKEAFVITVFYELLSHVECLSLAPDWFSDIESLVTVDLFKKKKNIKHR